MLFNLKPLDLLIVVLVLVFGIASAFFIYSVNSSSLYVKITSPLGIWVYPIQAEETLQINGNLGITSVLIKNSTVRIISSPCKNQTCLSSGKISLPSEFLACMPNGVLVTILGDEVAEITENMQDLKNGSLQKVNLDTMSY